VPPILQRALPRGSQRRRASTRVFLFFERSGSQGRIPHGRGSAACGMTRVNEFGQPIGFAVPDWRPPPRPRREPLAGRLCRVEPIDPDRHAADLFAANGLDADGRGWTYLPYGPFATLAEYRAWIEAACLGDDPLFFAIVDAATGCA